jgi:hypothetical protein
MNSRVSRRLPAGIAHDLNSTCVDVPSISITSSSAVRETLAKRAWACPVCYIGELGAVQPVSRNVPNLGPRVTIVDNAGKRISRLGGLGPGLGPTEFLAPHGLAVDSHGDLYIGEVSWTNWPQTFRDKPRPDNLRSLHKFRKVV